MSNADDMCEPIKDENASHPIPHAWRRTFQEVVKSLSQGDYQLTRVGQSVLPLDPASANRIARCVAAYGKRLGELPDETWASSVAQWMVDCWEVLVDLWTVEGPSDLVLHARVFETADGFRISVDSVHVP